MSNFKITIDGRQVEAEPGMTVLQAAKKAEYSYLHFARTMSLSRTEHAVCALSR